MTETPPRRSGRIRPLDALRAIRALIRNPDDTALVFEIIEALSGRSRTRVFDRFRRTKSGRRLLAERPDLLARLTDRAQLLALPAGSLGRTYGEFMTREQISADGLVDASESGRREDLPAERRWFADRLRDTHDLWHVVTGYGRDLVGEASLLAFTYAQTRNPGIGFIVAVAYFKARGINRPTRRLLRDGYRRGRRAAWLPGVEWEPLLELPLARVREQLGIAALPAYQPVRSEGAPALASPAERRHADPRACSPASTSDWMRARSSSVSRESSNASRAASRARSA
jgi:ubiquinone biosynthesis protein COQ4